MNAEFTRYGYKMEGLDRQWNEVASDPRIVSYSSLQQGSYNLRVQAAVSRGPGTEPGTMLRIHILPPGWKSWWFSTILAAFLVLLAWAAYRYRVQRIAQQFDIRLEERVNERTRIARELHDSLLQ